MNRYTISAVLLIGIIVFTACIYFSTKPSFISHSHFEPTSTISPESLEELRISRFAREMLDKMTVEEKVGQMFMWGINESSLSAQSEKMLKDTHAGGVILMGTHTPDQLKSLTASLSKINDSLALFIAVDGEINLMDRYGLQVQPSVSMIDQLTKDELCSRVLQNTTYLKLLGINLNFGIVADIGYYNDSFIKGRTYGNTPETVSEKVKIALTCSGGILTTVKHFPGHGNTKSDSHSSIPNISLTFEEWQKSDALPFYEAIGEYADFIMFGHLLFSNIASAPASLSKQFHDTIRTMGFQGLTITDDLGMLEGSKYTPQSLIIQAFNADNDIILYINSSLPKKDMFSSTIEYVNRREIPMERIDRSVERILRKKYRLMENTLD
jgi:beta-N-acetylhexosaminidase